jgi:hypothetical protein
MKRLVCLVILAACSDANVAGNYTLAITYRDNPCNMPSWTVGDQLPGVQATVTQDGSSVTMTVMGLAGIYLGTQTGTNVFTGSVDGDEVDVAITGTAGKSTGNCAYTINASLAATANGDTLAGRIEYRAATNNGSDCGTLTGCISRQDFNGTRPP